MSARSLIAPIRLALLAAVLALLALGAAQAHARPSLGVNIVHPDDAQLAEVEALGAERVRAFVFAGSLQDRPFTALRSGPAADYKRFVQRMRARGIAVDFTLMGVAGNQSMVTPPADPAQYADFAARFAALFPGDGISYELWNEADEGAWWAPSPSPAAYSALVKATYPAIKAVAPTATVVLAATTGNNYDWINSLYDNGVKGSFDAAAVHTDTACLVAAPADFYRENNRIGRYSFLGYKEVRATMLARGDDKPIFMTEFGWSSTDGGPTSCQRGASAGKKPSGVSEARQAEMLTQAVRCMAADPYVAVADWFTMRDAPTQSIPELRSYGLLRSSGAQKPSYGQMQGLLRGTVSSAGSCADLSGPQIQFLTPKVNQKYRRGPLRLKLTVTDSSGIKGIRFYNGTKKFTSVNKDAIVNSGKPVALKWHGAQCQRKGNMRIKAVAVDKLGNTQSAQVIIKKTSRPKKGKACKAKAKKAKKKK